MRLPYTTLSPTAYQGFIQIKKCLEKSSLGLKYIELIYLRISQMNGCEHCIKVHKRALHKESEADNRITELANWRQNNLFTDKECAGLAWAESLTNIVSTHADDEFYLPLKNHFTDTEISDLTLAVSLMNAFNRIAISMRA